MTRTARLAAALRPRPGRSDAEDGVIMIMMTLMLAAVILVIGAMAVDLGSAFSRQRALQKAADLAALAGAARLPDIAAARTAAIESLCAPENAVLGWPIGSGSSCRSNTGWATSPSPTSPNEADGEIEFYGGAADPVTGAYDPAQRINTGDARAIRVVTPKATVDFALAGAVPGLARSIRVQKTATAAAGTPFGGTGGAIPFFLFLDDGTGGSSEFCLKDRGSSNTPGCPATSSNRGFIDEPRSDVNGNVAQFRANVKFGYDHPLHAYPLWPCGGTTPPQTALTGVCPTQTSLPAPNASGTTRVRCRTPDLAAGTFYDYPGLGSTRDVNCLQLASGGRSGPLEQGLVDDSDARLRRSCNSVFGGAPHVSGSIDLNKLFSGGVLSLDASLLNQSLSWTQQQTAAAALLAGAPNPVGAPLFSPAIFGCPRLALVPRLQLKSTELPNGGNSATTTFPIQGFSYVWIGGDDADNGLIWTGGSLQGVRAYVIDDTYLPGTSSAPDTSLLAPVVGPGRPLVTTLVRDASDPPI